MKLSIIFSALKILLTFSEQIVEMIDQTAIPKEEQPDVAKEVEKAMNNLLYAKSRIEIDP
jgi:hypothetical protein